MRITTRVLWIGAGVVIVAAVAGYRLSMPPQKVGGSASVATATPPGVTLQLLAPVGAGPRAVSRGVVYADGGGMTLYTYDKDEPGKSHCQDDCLKTWRIAAAPPDAKPSGDWSVIVRDDKTAQWALRGKPLYLFSKEAKVAEEKGNGAEGVWHSAMLQPAAEVPLPLDITIRDVADANGQALVDARGMTLYTFDGDVKDDGQACYGASCGSQWLPVQAAAIANPVGDFAPMARKDGTRQWSYRGMPLYTFAGDLETGDANGIGLEGKWRPALWAGYFIPAEAAFRKSLGRGKILTTADGMTLYRRDGHRVQNSGHSVRRGAPGVPSIGRDIGINGCDAECTKTWRPFPAAADAKPSGYWQIAARPDGARQWVYKGYALYTYAGDKKPGDMTGDDVYELIVSDGVHKVADWLTPMSGSAALYWSYAAP